MRKEYKLKIRKLLIIIKSRSRNRTQKLTWENTIEIILLKKLSLKVVFFPDTHYFQYSEVQMKKTKMSQYRVRTEESTIFIGN